MKSRLAAAIVANNPGVVELADAEKAVEAVFALITTTLAQGGRAEARGFGSFAVRHKPAREARNPRTGEAVQVPAKNVVVFKPGKDLRDTLNRPTA